MHAVFKTTTYTSVIPWIIAVDSLAHSLHNQVTYHVQNTYPTIHEEWQVIMPPDTLQQPKQYGLCLVCYGLG